MRTARRGVAVRGKDRMADVRHYKEDFEECTENELLDTQDYLQSCIKDYKKRHATDDMLWCMSHLSAIRQVLLEKKG